MNVNDYYALAIQIAIKPGCKDRRLLDHFKIGDRCKAAYILEPPEDQGWLARASDQTEHWLSPHDGQNHSHFYEEDYIMQNFVILKAGTYQIVNGEITGERYL